MSEECKSKLFLNFVNASLPEAFGCHWEKHMFTVSFKLYVKRFEKRGSKFLSDDVMKICKEYKNSILKKQDDWLTDNIITMGTGSIYLKLSMLYSRLGVTRNTLLAMFLDIATEHSQETSEFKDAAVYYNKLSYSFKSPGSRSKDLNTSGSESSNTSGSEDSNTSGSEDSNVSGSEDSSASGSDDLSASGSDDSSASDNSFLGNILTFKDMKDIFASVKPQIQSAITNIEGPIPNGIIYSEEAIKNHKNRLETIKTGIKEFEQKLNTETQYHQIYKDI